MSDHSTADPVSSGRPYVVRTVDGRPPAGLDELVSETPLVVSVASDAQTVVIQGPSRRDGDAVVLYEKSADGTGKDVRTWEIRVDGDHLVATERSIF